MWNSDRCHSQVSLSNCSSLTHLANLCLTLSCPNSNSLPLHILSSPHSPSSIINVKPLLSLKPTPPPLLCQKGGAVSEEEKGEREREAIELERWVRGWVAEGVAMSMACSVQCSVGTLELLRLCLRHTQPSCTTPLSMIATLPFILPLLMARSRCGVLTFSHLLMLPYLVRFTYPIGCSLVGLSWILDSMLPIVYTCMW